MRPSASHRLQFQPPPNSALRFSIARAGSLLRSRKLTAVQLLDNTLDQVHKTAPLNAYITVNPRDVLTKEAQASDDRHSKGAPLGPLDGIPLAVKDVFVTKNVRTTYYVPPYDATVVQRLRDSGALLIGKNNMDEFSMGSGSEHSHYGATLNPWTDAQNRRYVPGGSSGGSAAAVAAFAAFGALGGDTGGSVRLPAAYCGLVGLKPSYGRLSRWGLIAYASSLDGPGVLARSVADAASIFDTVSGPDARDSTCLDLPASQTRLAPESVRGMRVGIPKEYYVKELSAEIREVWQRGASQLREAGAQVEEVSLPHTKYALPAYYIIAAAEASSNLSRYDGVRYDAPTIEELYTRTRSEGFGPEVQRRILLGTFALSRRSYESFYRKAQQVRRLVRQDFERAFAGKVDLLLTPTAPTAAYEAGAHGADPVGEYINDVMTIPASMAGLPALSLPAGFSAGGLPLGLQLIGPALHEGRVLSAARALEMRLGLMEQAE